jgi:serine/threonine protein kinase
VLLRLFVYLFTAVFVGWALAVVGPVEACLGSSLGTDSRARRVEAVDPAGSELDHHQPVAERQKTTRLRASLPAPGALRHLVEKRDSELSSAEYAELRDLTENALVHRDIKPQNIMLTRSGAKLLDFNIASRVGDPVRTMSGTPPYQPPDADLTRWDVSTDLFAVGVTLYELVCDGKHPYPHSRPMPDVEPTDPKTYRNDLNGELAEFLLKACGNERSRRFATAAEMRAALETVRSGL